jgi:hypothetical protein
VIVWLPRSWIFILKCSAKVSSASYAWPFKPSQIFAQVVSQCDDNVQALLPCEENPNSIPASNSSSPSHLCRCQIAWRVHFHHWLVFLVACLVYRYPW